MVEMVRYPRAVAAGRAAIYLFGVLVGTLLLAGTVSFLGIVVLVGVVSLLVTGSGTAALAAGAVGLIVAGAMLAAVGLGTRRADRWLVDSARVPDPLDVVAERYAAGDIDEATLEREIERLLADPAANDREVRSVRGHTADRPIEPLERALLRE
jgi:uncharacterized membrane protein